MYIHGLGRVAGRLPSRKGPGTVGRQMAEK